MQIKILDVNTDLFPSFYVTEGVINGYTVKFAHKDGMEYIYELECGIRGIDVPCAVLIGKDFQVVSINAPLRKTF